MASYMNPLTPVSTRCTIEKSNGRFCDSKRAEDMPFPICFEHALMVFKRMQGRIEEANIAGIAMPIVLMNVLDNNRANRNTSRHRVYYVLVGDLIKIGVTGQAVHKRMKAYPPDSELLATEPGGYDLEFERHQQFAHLLAERKEWFHPGPELLDHIATLAEGKRNAA